MAKKSKRKNPKRPKKEGFLSKLRKQWGVLSFLLLFAGLMILFYLVWATNVFQQNILSPLLNANASVSGAILNLFGFDVQVSGDRIFSSDFQISIRKGCDGVEALALFITAVITYPASIKSKLWGILVGSAFLLVMNLIRIISLYVSGIYFPDVFEFMHVEVWQTLFILLAILTWLVWVRWSNQRRKNAAA